jgi:hypothetical protein
LAQAFLTGKFGADDFARLAIFVAVLAVLTVTGLAIVRRWRGWRGYAGTVGWLLILIYCLHFIGMLRMWRRWGFDRGDAGLLLFTWLLCALGFFILVATREEPPARPFPVVTLAGALLVCLAVLYFVSLPFTPGPEVGIPIFVMSIWFAISGAVMIRRTRGWRNWAGLIAWCMIVVGCFYAVTQLTMFQDVGNMATGLLVAAIGYFILWAKRQEPPRKTATAVAA